MIAVLLRDTHNEDWKTQTARNQPSLAKGDVVNVIEREIVNFYGKYSIVKHEEKGMFYVKQDSYKEND